MNRTGVTEDDGEEEVMMVRLSRLLFLRDPDVSNFYLFVGELQQILSTDQHPSYSAEFYSSYINMLLGVFYPICRDLRELRHLVKCVMVLADRIRLLPSKVYQLTLMLNFPITPSKAHLLTVFQTSNHLLGPKPFPLDRLLAVFYSVVDSRVAPTASIFSQVRAQRVVSMWLLLSHPPSYLRGTEPNRVLCGVVYFPGR
ncbi:hypothetical protein XENOCAPTIV_019957 [Xenoophorus captivus]|uniref:Uncharacterized protein n=1 Tax=Xenoophorus captivus TaxID=1517983 RepID=A0ABV0RWF8_9TELE